MDDVGSTLLQRRKFDVLAVAEIGIASTPLELGVAETRLDALSYPHPASRTQHRRGAAFKHRVSLATNLAANFWLRSIQNFRIMQDIVSKILRIVI